MTGARAREYGFASWARLKAEVDRRGKQRPEVRSWQGMRDSSAKLLERRTGRNVADWNRYPNFMTADADDLTGR